MAPGIVDIAPAIHAPLKAATQPDESRADVKNDLDVTLVLHHSLIPTDFDPLRFEAAASAQIQTSSLAKDTKAHTLSPYLVSSPYNTPAQLLDLRRLPLQSILFAKALTHLKPIRPDYALASYEESFNWSEVLLALRNLARERGHEWEEQSFYIVIFRSWLQAGIDNDLLYQLDAKSHEEATQSGGLLKYWFGKPNEGRRNLATCFWHSRDDARRGGTGPWHKRARLAARDFYESIVFSTHRFVVGPGALDYRIEDWKDEP